MLLGRHGGRVHPSTASALPRVRSPFATDQDLKNVTHGMADLEPGLRLHYVTAGEGARTIVLLHGFPQTWWQWHRVIPGLVEDGFRVVAPDHRGAGHSSRPAGGYDKKTMAGDLHGLLRRHLRIEGPLVLVGHDIGLMIAYAYAQAYRGEVSRLVVVDAPLPGTAVFDRLRADPRVWHFAFHGARDVAEMLVSGREREYLQAFFNARIFDPSAIRAADLEIYTSAYAAPGAMRAGFELYRAFDRDADDNRGGLTRNGKLTIPVLAVGGATSTSGPLVEEMMREVAGDVAGLRVPETAHWVAEENPRAFVDALLEFTRSAA
jgi:pimeloyl-ACP methyl ester carboxylesterase